MKIRLPSAEFSTEILFEPGFDERDSENTFNKGSRGLTIWFVLYGVDGVVTCTIKTGWMLRPLLAYYEPGRKQIRSDIPGLDRVSADKYPTSGSIAFHEPDPEGNQDRPCQYLGVPCKGEGSFLAADHILEELIRAGHDGVWELMKDFYYRQVSSSDEEDE